MTAAIITPAAAELVTQREQLLAGARQFAEAAKAPGTRRVYRGKWQAFVIWCEHQDLTALPASALTVTLYITERALEQVAVSTIAGDLAAIRKAHETAGHLPSPTLDVTVREVMSGIRRQLGTAARRPATPLVTAQLRELLAALPEDSATAVRDRALLLLGFAGALRRSELVALDVEDLRRTP